MIRKRVTVYLTDTMIKNIDKLAVSWNASRSKIINLAINKFMNESQDEIEKKLDMLINSYNKDHHYNFLQIEILGLLTYLIFKNENEAQGLDSKEKQIYVNKKIDLLIKSLVNINAKKTNGFLARFYNQNDAEKRNKNNN